MAFQVDGEHHSGREGATADNCKELAALVDPVTLDQAVNDRLIERAIPTAVQPNVQDETFHVVSIDEFEHPVKKPSDAFIRLIARRIVLNIYGTCIRQMF